MRRASGLLLALVGLFLVQGGCDRALPYRGPTAGGDRPSVDAALPDLAFAVEPIGCRAGADFPEDAPWPMAGRCPDHAGRSPFAGPARAVVRWSFDTGRPIDSSPVVGGGEVVYLGAADGTLRALDGASGTVRWAMKLEAPLGVPALGPSGSLLVGGYTVAGPSWFHALDAQSGRERWKYPVFEAFGPTLDGSGRVYFADAERVLVPRVANGDEQAQYRVPGALGLDPLLVEGSSLVSATTRGVVSLGLRGAGASWSASVEPHLIAAPPALGPDGTVWAGTDDGVVFALDAGAGGERRRWSLGAPTGMTAAIARDGTAWIGAGTALFALAASQSSPRLRVPLAAAARSLILDADGVLYCGCADGALVAVETATGRVRWSLAVGAGALRARPALGAAGTLYVPSDDGRLYAVGAP